MVTRDTYIELPLAPEPAIALCINVLAAVGVKDVGQHGAEVRGLFPATIMLVGRARSRARRRAGLRKKRRANIHAIQVLPDADGLGKVCPGRCDRRGHPELDGSAILRRGRLASLQVCRAPVRPRYIRGCSPGQPLPGLNNSTAALAPHSAEDGLNPCSRAPS